MIASVTRLPTARQRAARKAAATRQARRVYRVRYGIVCPPWCTSLHKDGEREHLRSIGSVGVGWSSFICCDLTQEPYREPALRIMVLGGKQVACVALTRSQVEDLRVHLCMALGYLPKSGLAL
jgi:hypothetical protein